MEVLLKRHSRIPPWLLNVAVRDTQGSWIPYRMPPMVGLYTPQRRAESAQAIFGPASLSMLKFKRYSQLTGSLQPVTEVTLRSNVKLEKTSSLKLLLFTLLLSFSHF